MKLVIKKCDFGVGINEAIKSIKSLFIYPGYLIVAVLADITVDIKELT